MYWDGLHFGRHLAVLGAPLVVALILGRRAWLHARAVSLGAYLLMYGTFQDAFIAHIDTTVWQHPAVRTPFAVASLGLALLACIEALRRRRRTAEAESPARQAIP
jgi:hypothetical protein